LEARAFGPAHAKGPSRSGCNLYAPEVRENY
jgi:hypothetical protein